MDTIGIIAIIAITPNPSTRTFAVGIASAAPCAKARMKVAVIGPDATPPESYAIPTKMDGTKYDNRADRANPGKRKCHNLSPGMSMRIIDMVTAKAIPIDSVTKIFFFLMCPDVTDSTCSVNT